MFTTQTEGKGCAGVGVMTVTGRMRDSGWPTSVTSQIKSRVPIA